MNFPPPPPGFIPPPPPGMPPMKNKDNSIHRLPPEGSFPLILFCYALKLIIRFSSRCSKITKMGTNAKEALWREAKRGVCGHGKAGTFVLVHRERVCVFMTNITGSPS